MSQNPTKEAYEIVLLGNTLNVKTSLAPEEIRQLVILLEDQVSELKKQNSNLPPQKLYLLALLGVAEKYLALRAQVEAFKSEISGEVGHLKDYVEQFIQHPEPFGQSPLPGTNDKASS